MAYWLISVVAFAEDPRFVPTLEHSQLPVTANREVSVPSSELLGHVHSHSHPDSDTETNTEGEIGTETDTHRHRYK